MPRAQQTAALGSRGPTADSGVVSGTEPEYENPANRLSKVWEADRTSVPALLVVNHHQAARIALRLLVRRWAISERRPVNPDETTSARLDAAFTRLRQRLETKNVTIESVKDVARESLVRAKAQIEID